MMKTSARKKRQAVREGLSTEYWFDYSKSKPNRFALKPETDAKLAKLTLFTARRGGSKMKRVK